MRAILVGFLKRLLARLEQTELREEPPDELVVLGSDDVFELMRSQGYTQVLYGRGPWVHAGQQPDGNPAGTKMQSALIFVHPDGYVSVNHWPKVLAGTMTAGLGEHVQVLHASSFLKFLADHRLRIERNLPLEIALERRKKAA